VIAVDDPATANPFDESHVPASQGWKRHRHSRDPLLQRKLMFKKHTAENAYTQALCQLAEQPADMEALPQ
jgi:hypothetical protein